MFLIQRTLCEPKITSVTLKHKNFVVVKSSQNGDDLKIRPFYQFPAVCDTLHFVDIFLLLQFHCVPTVLNKRLNGELYHTLN